MIKRMEKIKAPRKFLTIFTFVFSFLVTGILLFQNIENNSLRLYVQGMGGISVVHEYLNHGSWSSWKNTGIASVGLSGSTEIETTYSDIFWKFFPLWRQMVYSKLNVTDFSLYNEPYSESLEKYYYRERWNLVHTAMFDIYAYEMTGNRTYLNEAKFFIDNLLRYTDKDSGALTMYDFGGDQPGGFSDAFLTIAMYKLNKYGLGNYNITDRVNKILSRANVNNSTDLAWGWLWNDTSKDPKVGVNRMTPFAFMLSYFTSEGIGNYTSEVQRIYHWVNRARLSDNLLAYSIGDTTSNYHYTMVCWYMFLMAYKYLPEAFNVTDLQVVLSAINNQAYDKLGQTSALFSYSMALTAHQVGFDAGNLTQLIDPLLNVYNFESGTEFFTSYNRWRSHLLQIIWLLTVTGNNPSMDIPSTSFSYSEANNRHYFSTFPVAWPEVVDHYGIRFQLGPSWLFHYLYPYPVDLSITYNGSWVGTATYGNINTTVVFDKYFSFLSLDATSSPDTMAIGGPYATGYLVLENGTVITVWDSDLETGVGNATINLGGNWFAVAGKPSNSLKPYALVAIVYTNNQTITTNFVKNAYIRVAEMVATKIKLFYLYGIYSNASEIKDAINLVKNGEDPREVFRTDISRVGNIGEAFRHLDPFDVWVDNTKEIKISNVDFSVSTLNITLDAPSGTNSTAIVYWPYSSAPVVQCINCSGYNWSFDSNSKLVTLNATHSSLVTWVLEVSTDSEAPQWFNLRHEPSSVTPENPVNIKIDWSDNVDLHTVIIYENSTGAWKEHVCNLSTGICSGEEDIPAIVTETFIHTIPKEDLNIGEVVAYYSFANDTSGNSNTTPYQTFVVQALPTTTSTSTPTTTIITTTTTSTTTTIITTTTSTSTTTTSATTTTTTRIMSEKEIDLKRYWYIILILLVGVAGIIIFVSRVLRKLQSFNKYILSGCCSCHCYRIELNYYSRPERIFNLSQT